VAARESRCYWSGHELARGHELRTIKIERHDRVAVVTLDRPQALNALNLQLMGETTEALTGLDSDPNVGCIVRRPSWIGHPFKDMVSERLPLAHRERVKIPIGRSSQPGGCNPCDHV
jgi:hypothetical protein